MIPLKLSSQLGPLQSAIAPACSPRSSWLSKFWKALTKAVEQSKEPKNLLLKGWDAEILIDAPPSLVWSVIVDFATYQDWNPFVLEAIAVSDRSRCSL
jgi:hypothetical protein